MFGLHNIYIFNPEFDYALAEFSPGYTPPAGVIALRRKLWHIPLRVWNQKKDFVLLLDDIPDASEPGTISPSHHKEFFNSIISDIENYQIVPWGWTPDLKHRLRMSGAPDCILPSDDRLTRIRALAHRSSTIRFNEILNNRLINSGYSKENTAPLPKEFKSVEKALDFYNQFHDVYFKYPWSSSGRGVLHANSNTSTESLIRWITGALRRQGSVMGETTFDKLIDFATEWKIIRGEPEFLGLSIFETNPEGKYNANKILPQNELLKEIQSICSEFDERYIKAQQQTIKMMAPDYTGYLGIDMMGNRDGVIRGCVELNFRMTMGIVALLQQNNIEIQNLFSDK